MTTYAVSPPVIGVDFEKTYKDGKLEHTLGDEILGADGVTYKFVRFTAAKTKGLVYIIDESFTLGSGLAISGQTSAPLVLGVPQINLEAPNSDQTYAYGWVAIKGPFQVFAAGNTAANTELYTSSLTGVLHSNVSGAKLVHGIKLTAAAGVTASALTNAYAAVPLHVPSDL